MAVTADPGLTDADVVDAIRSLHDDDTVLIRKNVATKLLMTEDGLRKRHRRMGLTWPEYLARICPPNLYPLRPHATPDTDDMTVRAIQVPLDPEMLDALRRLSAREERHPRIQAARLLRDALRAQGELRETTPLRLAEAEAR